MYGLSADAAAPPAVALMVPRVTPPVVVRLAAPVDTIAMGR